MNWVSASIGIVVLTASTASIGINIGVLIALRLAKSGIEYVILAGSSLLLCQELDPDIGRVWCIPCARIARFFQRF